MSKQITNKNTAIEKLKKGSLLTAVICAAAALADLYGAFCSVYICLSDQFGMTAGTRFQAVEIFTAFVIVAGIVLTAGIMFFRIAGNGIPFTGQTVRSLNIIGILFMLRAILPPLAGTLISGSEAFHIAHPDLFSLIITGFYTVIEGLMFLFIANIIHYGSMLQLESDETL